MLADTAGRVAQNTDDGVNRRIEREIEDSAEYFARHPQEVNQRLRELDQEWDIERTLEANAATLALAGLLLGAAVDRRFLVLPAVVSGFLLQHALQGWCPPVPFFRKRGVRTASEIGRERYALKTLRGDFGVSVSRPTDGPRAQADAALQAVRR